MKKWLFPALLAALLLTAVGCDRTETPAPDLPDTVDELTVVTTEEETQATATEPETAPPETEAPPAETEALSPEEASALLDEIVLRAAERGEGPVEVNMTSEVELTAYMFGFSGTTTIPLSGYYAIDGDRDIMVAYAVPMEGTGVCIVANGMLYLHDGADTALKASLDEASLDEVKAILLERLKKQMGAGLPSLSLPEAKTGLFDTELSVPVVEFDLTELFGSALAAVPLEDAFQSVSAFRDAETGTVTLTLSGISESVLDTLEGILTALPEGETDPSEENGYDKETALALASLLREQAATAVTVTLTVNDAYDVTETSVITTLDLTSLPQLTANMPVEMKVTTTIAINRENVAVEEPENADLYEEVPLTELLPPEETEEETAEEMTEEATEEMTEEPVTE